MFALFKVAGFRWFLVKPKRNLLMRWFRSFNETGFGFGFAIIK